MLHYLNDGVEKVTLHLKALHCEKAPAGREKACIHTNTGMKQK